jgi:hypothetical protein
MVRSRRGGGGGELMNCFEDINTTLPGEMSEVTAQSCEQCCLSLR